MKEIVEQLIKQVLEDQKLSNNTKASYKSDLNELIEYSSNNNYSIKDVNQKWVRDYLKYLEQANRERSSYNRRASTFRLFLKYIYQKKLAPTNYSLIVANATTFEKAEENPLGKEDINSIIEGENLSPQSKLILYLIGKIGLTATQIADLNTYQIDFEKKRVNLSDTDSIEIENFVFNKLRSYILEIRPTFKNAKSSLSLFFNDKEESLSEIDIYKLIKDLSIESKLEGKLTTRNLKKLLNKRQDIVSMQDEVSKSIVSELI